VLGNVYHPQTDKGASDSKLRSYLYEFMATIESRFPSCGILITGELNRLDTSGFRNAFTLKQIVKFPTRGNRTLDLILANLSEYSEDPVKRLAFGLSDHPSIEVQPVYRSKQPKAKQYIFSRDLRPPSKSAMSLYLDLVDVEALVKDKVSCEEKLDIIEKVIVTEINEIMPLKPKTVVANEVPWVNRSLNTLILRDQRALASGNMVEYRTLRNRVYRERKSRRSKFYAS